jgi:hypothetical protein
VLKLEVVQWQPKPKQKPVAGSKPKPEAPKESGESPTSMQSSPEPSSYAEMDEETERELRRIQNIMNMEISNDDKIKQLNRIEMDARRNIELEEGKIRELKLR